MNANNSGAKGSQQNASAAPAGDEPPAGNTQQDDLAHLERQLTNSIVANNQRLLDAQAAQHQEMNSKMDRLIATLEAGRSAHDT